MALIAVSISVNEVRGQTIYGFRIGGNISTLSSGVGNAGDPQPLAGLVAGSFVRYELKSNFATQVEILYSSKGAQFQGETEDGFNIETDLQVVYLEIPALLHYSFPLSTVLRPSLYTGPFVAFELTERVRQTAEDFTQSQDSNLLKSPDIGIATGVDLFLEAANFDVVLGVRYTYGLVGLTDPDIDIEGSPSTRTLGITAGFLF